MDSQRDYHLGLLYLVHLLIGIDGMVDEHEQKQILKIRDAEGVAVDVFEEFENQVSQLKNRDIYQ